MTLGEIFESNFKRPSYYIVDQGERLVAQFNDVASVSKLRFLFGYQWTWVTPTRCWCYKSTYSMCFNSGFSDFDHK